MVDPGEGPPPPNFWTIKYHNCERAKTKCLRAGPHLTSTSGSATVKDQSRSFKRAKKNFKEFLANELFNGVTLNK